MEQMKEFMEFSGLKVCQRVVDFADGSLVRVSSVQVGDIPLDRIDIYVPESAGGRESLVAQASILIHVAYYDVTGTQLKYAYYDGSSWTTEVVDTNMEVSAIRMELGSNGIPHLLYCADTEDIYYAVRSGGSWSKYNVHDDGTQTSDLACVFPYALALKSDNEPAISFQDKFGALGSYDLDYKYGWNGSSFDNWDADLGATMLNPLPGFGSYDTVRNDLIFDGSDDPYVSFYDDTSGNEEIRVGKKSGGSWSKVGVVGQWYAMNHNNGFPYGPIVDFDSSGDLYIIATKGKGGATPSRLTYNVWNGAAWSGLTDIDTDNTADIPLYSMFVDSSDVIYVLYDDIDNTDLTIGYNDGGVTTEQVLTTNVNWASMDEDSDSNQVIVWCETGGNLKWKKRTGAATFTSAATIDSGNTNYCVVKCA